MPNLNPRNYIAGHHTAFYSVASPSASGGATWLRIGSTREGWRIKYQFLEQQVKDDAFGDGDADAIQQGANMTVEGVGVEAGILRSTNVLFVNQVGVEGHSNRNVGRRGSDNYGALALTPIAGTPAEGDLGVGKSWLFYLASIINDPELLLSSKLREIPCTFRILPDPTTHVPADGSATTTNLFYNIVATSTLSGVSAVGP